MREFALYFLFLVFLGVRFVADVKRFPLDGYSPDGLTAVDTIEYLTFYSCVYFSFLLVLRSRSVQHSSSYALGLTATGLYMFLHFLEYFIPAGGRAAHYAPADHFLSNLVTGFAATGDIGLWQFLRLPVCATFLYASLRSSGFSPIRSLSRLATLYLVFMLYVHPRAWAFLPSENPVDDARLFATGVRNLLICAYVTAGLVIVCWWNSRAPNGRSWWPRVDDGWRVWCALYCLLMLPAPTFVERYTATELCLVMVTTLTLRGSLNLLLSAATTRVAFSSIQIAHLGLLAAAIMWLGLDVGRWLLPIVLGVLALEQLTDLLALGSHLRVALRLSSVLMAVGLSYGMLIWV